MHSLNLLLRQETPQVFYVSDLAWLASFVFLLALTLTLPTAEERRFRTRLCRLVPVVCLPQFILLYFRTGISPHKTPSKPVSTPLEGAMI